MLVLAPIAGLVVGVCTGFLKEKERDDSWARWIYTLAPYPFVCLPNASALYSWGHWLITVAPYLPKPVLYVPSLSTLQALKPWVVSALPYVAPPLAMLPRTLLLVGCILLGQRVGESFVGVGLTGGIATGKSTVSNLYKKNGAVIVDADVIAREVVMPGRGAYNAIVKKFGPEVLNEDRTINRAKLGSIIFSDPAKRQVLNGCTHKFILWEMFAQLFYHRFVGRKRLVVFDAPLLFETKILERFCYPIVVVACSEANELNRLIQRDNLSEDDAKKRIQSQMKLHHALPASQSFQHRTALPSPRGMEIMNR
ncbi:hypothetical protein ATCC90586_006892 [Pythium insidiosum]|nr:hypothetical protein ATCC90586_006892 [Pythium insidiosum]